MKIYTVRVSTVETYTIEVINIRLYLIRAIYIHAVLSSLAFDLSPQLPGTQCSESTIELPHQSHPFQFQNTPPKST